MNLFQLELHLKIRVYLSQIVNIYSGKCNCDSFKASYTISIKSIKINNGC